MISGSLWQPVLNQGVLNLGQTAIIGGLERVEQIDQINFFAMQDAIIDRAEHVLRAGK